jgi:hypothetical protein
MNMRLLSLALASGLWTVHASPVQAQCDGCAANLACTADPAYPTLCPTQPPDATAGEPYAADITFWLPNNFTDPGTGFNVDFLIMTITGVSGLPYGLEITYSEPSGVYYPQENQYGCARICGTPVGAGTYTVTISIIAHVAYNGFELNAVKQFPLTLVVQPGTGSNTGFTFTPSTACGNANVQFDALIDGQGSPVTYDWDFGNGDTSIDASSLQHYDAPGIYTISLQTTIGGYVLNNVDVGGVNDNWCGDVEEISLFGSCQGDPDIYFILTDGQGGTYESSHGEDSGSESWSGLNITLGTPPYAIEFWDEDPVSVDDALGTYNIPQNGEGDYTFTVADGTFGSLYIDLVPQQLFNDTDTVVVFAAPQPIISYDTLAANICVADTGLVNITWFNDGDTVATGNMACINADSSGTWWAVVTNGFGCATPSDTILICPAITIEQNGEVLYTQTGLDNYVWSLNGTPIAGADGPFLIAETGGVYTVSAMNTDGCPLTAEYVLVITGSTQLDKESASLEVFPNPNLGSFQIRAACAGWLRLCDAQGRQVLPAFQVPGPGTSTLGNGALAPGSYFLLLETADERFVTPVAVLP